jgi:hypothetical protein
MGPGRSNERSLSPESQDFEAWECVKEWLIAWGNWLKRRFCRNPETYRNGINLVFVYSPSLVLGRFPSLGLECQ